MKMLSKIALVVVFSTLPLIAAEKADKTEKKGGKENGPKARFFAKYDLNHNGVIDADEKEAIRKDYAANQDGELKRFDKNTDGKLDDEEIAAIKPPTGKKKAASEPAKDEKSDKDAKATSDKKP